MLYDTGSSVSQTVPRRAAGRLTAPGSAACYHRAGMYAQLENEYRHFFLMCPGETEPLRLFLALFAKGQAATETFNDTRLLKFAIRQLKAVQGAALGQSTEQGARMAGKKGSSPVVDRKGKGKEQVEERDLDGASDDGLDQGEEADPRPEHRHSFVPTKLNPVWLSLYGMMLHVSQSYQPAISRFLLRLKLAQAGTDRAPFSLPTARLRTRQEAAARQSDACDSVHAACYDSHDGQPPAPDCTGASVLTASICEIRS